MGFDINGVWTSPFYPIQDKDAGIAILASKFQTLIQTDIKSGFNNCITRDGSGKPTANLNLNGHKIINLSSGINGADAVNKGQMDTAIAQAQELAIASSTQLLSFKWFDYILDNQSWLRADTFSWQDGNVYTNAYNHLVDDIDVISSSTETIAGTTITYYQATDGHKIVLADQENNVSAIYAATGTAWYYILDTDNTRFKLPRTNPNTQEIDITTQFPVKGNGKGIGLTDGTKEFGVYLSSSATTGLAGKDTAYGTDVGTVNAPPWYVNANLPTVGVTTDGTKSGIIADVSNKSTIYAGNKYLYFYVGQFTQTATEQTAGLNAELFNDKVDKADMTEVQCVVETYSNGTDWYRIWSDGRCEQGGEISNSGTNTQQITFLQPFVDTNYYFNRCNESTVTGQATNFANEGYTDKQTTGIKVYCYSSITKCTWEAKGYIS